MTPAEHNAVLRLYGLERLEDATRETWPWGMSVPGVGNWVPRMPDFPNDDAAAVKLAERMAPRGTAEVDDDPARGIGWLAEYAGSDWFWRKTLGSALLAALTAQENEHDG